MSRKSSVLNKVIPKRASSYENQNWAVESVRKFDYKRWKSCNAETTEDVETAPPPDLLEMLQNVHVENSETNVETFQEPKNILSELLGFFDHCAKLINELIMNP